MSPHDSKNLAVGRAIEDVEGLDRFPEDDSWAEFGALLTEALTLCPLAPVSETGHGQPDEAQTVTEMTPVKIKKAI